MTNILIIVEVIISIALSSLILIQNKDGGLSATFGGGGSFKSTKRGAEKIIYRTTIVFAIAFVVNALAIVVI